MIIVAQTGIAYGTHTWQYYFQRGRLQYKAEMLDWAVLSLTKALEMNPLLYQADNYLAEIYLKKNDKMLALSYLELSLEIHDAQADVHNKIGDLYEFFAEYDLAFDHFKKTVQIDPAHILGNMNLVRFYLKIGDKVTADRYFTQSYQSGKKISDLYMEEAKDSEESGKFSKSIELYTLCMEKCPAEIAAYHRLFEIYRNKKEFARAASVYERLIFLKPDDERVYIKMGYLYFTDPLPGKKLMHLQKSVHYFQEAIKLNPSKTDTYYALSKVYQYMGKHDDAKKMEEKALSLFESKGQK